jgi:ubiquinone/menaquinone biosynthesis C-methylase UbiE
MNEISHFTQPDSAPAYFIDFLDMLDRLPDIQAARATTIERMQLAPGHKVLDVGCGIGGATLRFADAVGPGGLAAGVDVSSTLIDVATRRVGERCGVQFRIGDARGVPYPAASFDFAYSERVFLYLPDRLAAIHEMARVVKPGGRVFLADVDFDCTAIYSRHPPLTRRMISAIAASIPNRNSARELPALVKQAGLHELSIDAYAVTTPYEFLIHGMSGALTKAVDDGGIGRAEVDEWLAEQGNLHATGDFFQTWLFVRCSGVV